MSFDFDHNIHKFEEQYFTFSDCINELGGAACLIFIFFYFLWSLLSIGTARSFFKNMVEMIERKYNEASEWR